MITVCENKSEGNQIFIELVSEILHKIVMSPSKTDIMKVMKRPIFEVYMGNVTVELCRIFSNAPKKH